MVEDILKIEDDYFDISNISYIDDYVLVFFRNFDYRPNTSLNLTKPKYFKIESLVLRIDQEQIQNLFKKSEFDINYNISTDGYIKQFFLNIAIKIPLIIKPCKYSQDKYNIINSINFKDIYDKIFEVSEIDKDKFILVYTKKFYVAENNTMIKKFDYNSIYYYNCFYIIPHINIFYNYEKVDNKYLCELSGTIIN